MAGDSDIDSAGVVPSSPLHVHDTFIPDRDRITSAHLVKFERLHTE